MTRGLRASSRWIVGAVAVVAVVLTVSGTIAQAQITPEIKASPNAAANQGAIDAAVKKDVAALASGTANARQALIGYASAGPTPAFLDVYAVSLNNHLQPLAKSPDIKVRLNAAIVAASVAQLANNARLADVLTQFVSDKTEPIAYWGLRGARFVVPNLLKPPINNPKHALIPAITNAVKTHRRGLASGWIATEAYGALALDLNPPAGKPRPPAATIANTITPVQDLLAARINQYKEGVPAMPTAEQIASGYLSNPAVWPVHTPDQQVRTLQLYSDLLSLAAQQLVVPTINDNDKTELTSMIKLVGSAIAVTAEAGSPLANASRGAMNITKAMAPAEIVKTVDAIHPAITKTPKYSAVKPPPTIVDHKPAPAPATEPTTLPAGAALPPPPPVETPPAPEKPAPGGNRPPPTGGNRPPR